MANMPEGTCEHIDALFIAGLPVVVTEGDLDGLEFEVSVIGPLTGPLADARRTGAE